MPDTPAPISPAPAQNIPLTQTTTAISTNAPVEKLEAEIKTLERKTRQDETQKISQLKTKPAPVSPFDKIPSITPAAQAIANANLPAGQAGWLNPTQPPPNEVNLPLTPVSTHDKERKDQPLSPASPETPFIQEKAVEVETPPELKEWVQAKPDPTTIKLPKPVDDKFSEILLGSNTIPQPDIELPLTRPGFEGGLRHPIMSSLRWLATWCKRVILLAPKRVFFKKL